MRELWSAASKALTNAIEKSSLMIDDVFDIGHDITSSGKLVSGGFKADIEFDELMKEEDREDAKAERVALRAKIKKDLKQPKAI